jgi:hypothetical protein
VTWLLDRLGGSRGIFFPQAFRMWFTAQGIDIIEEP